MLLGPGAFLTAIETKLSSDLSASMGTGIGLAMSCVLVVNNIRGVL